LINSVVFDSGVAQLDHAVIVQFSGVAQSWYDGISTCLKSGVTHCQQWF